VSGSVEAVPAAVACARWVEARRMARMAKAGRQEPVVVLLDRGVSVAGGAAPEGPTAKRAPPEMAPQRLEKVESAPGNGMASAASDPRIWRPERHQRRPEHSRRVSPDGCGADGHAGGAGFRNLAARRPEMAPQELEIIESAPGDGMASKTSKPQDPAPGAMAHVSSAAPPPAEGAKEAESRGDADRAVASLKRMEARRQGGAMPQSGPNPHCERSEAPVQNERQTRRRRR
jgi:hypothetical protein